jgi:hypothetical protein
VGLRIVQLVPAVLFMPEPIHIRLGGGVSDSVVSPIVLGVVLIAGLFICFSSRNKALAAFLAGAILIPEDQVLLIGGAHFPMIRVLLVFGIIRMLRAKISSKKEILAGGWHWLDLAVLLYASFTAVNGILLYRESAAVVFQFGNLLTNLGAYFLLRYSIRGVEDVVHTLRVLAYVSVAVAAVMTLEQLTGRNPYALLGGANAWWYGTVQLREGKLRSTGSFAHPILAGSYGAMMLPMFVGLWWKDRKSRKQAGLGVGAAAVIALAANSSTCLLGLMAGVLALCLWPLRHRMRLIRWGLALMLVSLHLVMKAPVWQLISRIDLAGGSSSDHRYQILNQCILHFSDWALIGTKDFGSWGFGLWDLGNQYVFVADTAGFIPLVAFMAMIVFGFKYVGRARKASNGDKKQQLLAWALGASLFSNVVSFFGISYFDQTIVVWYGLLAMISAVYLQQPVAKTTKPAEAHIAAPELAYAGAGELLESDLEPDFEPREQRMYEI